MNVVIGKKNNDQTFRKHPKCSVEKSSFPKRKDTHIEKHQIAVWTKIERTNISKIG